ncbi:MAG TPA: DUF177 domain-containing protein [Methylomirabilota bacterium]|nr:DUF177 domain-containing protein [Methylomirabilota bacterium]
MIIRVSDLQDDGLLVANAGEFVAPFTDRSWRLDAVRLHVSRDGEDVVVVGDLAASVPLVCGRCLEEFRVDVRPRVDLRYVPRPSLVDDAELGADDLDLDFYENDELNLASLVETETTLALPMKPLCRADCRGLCPTCGANRNAAGCACPAPSADPRLAVLKDLTSRLNH